MRRYIAAAMSVRSRLLCGVLRRFAKATHTPIDQIAAAQRKALDASSKRTPKPPPRVSVEPTELRGVPGEWVSMDRSDASRVLLYMHGGSYVAGSPSSHRNLTWRLADEARCRVLALDYRLAPEHPYPAGLNDVLAAHAGLVERDDVGAVGWAGDSAGAGLMLASLRAAEERGLAMPVSALAISPWCDLAGRGTSWRTNAERDPWLTAKALLDCAQLYLGDTAGDDPCVSAAYATFADPPPTLIQVGESELLRDDATRVAERLRDAGAHVEVQLWKDVPHVWPIFAPMLPESSVAIRQAGRFLRAKW